MNQSSIVSIDIGAVCIGAVEIDQDKKILQSAYRFHEGKIIETVKEIIETLRNDRAQTYCCTGSSDEFFSGMQSYETLVCIIEAAKHYYPSLRSLIHVGGEKFYHFRFDDHGKYIDMKSSSSCAAGTGSFLDQQSKRLGLGTSSDIMKRALLNEGETPKIASRCSVFAKTDLIHAQQEGFSLIEICDGICLGLANNIADTLFNVKPDSPVIFSGGVSRNTAVVKHLEERIACPIQVHEYSHLFGAIGAAILFQNENADGHITVNSFSLREETDQKDYYYPPLTLTLSDYPDFKGIESFTTGKQKTWPAVEVDIYEQIANRHQKCFLGIDIGSTSTKAVITDSGGTVLAGFYTRTSGQPVIATQAIFAAIDRTAIERNASFSFSGAATTGSGRKFIGTIIGADLILDEISAHARAAYALDQSIDTIIEIGGQDAKFTTMRNGVVTFSKMNSVCAAGTGSFVEEQAEKLGIKLSQYAELVENIRSPLASDRCTVFMERDINHFLSKNYTVAECLAAVLFSIRENYLLKVAVEGAIGKRVCFQGATAKNRALVAAFEQKLQQPVFVSKFCHLTGALGAALTLIEERKQTSVFKGIDLYKNEIPIETEICELCLNHCRIRIATVQNTKVAFGFLCGRDYDTKKFVSKSTTESLYDLRNRALTTDREKKSLPKLGIAAGLQLFDEMFFWKKFFTACGIPFVTSEDMKDPVSRGKKKTSAEFCAPVSAHFGHVDYLADRCEALFLPIYLENQSDESNPARVRKYCYYSALSSSIVAQSIEDKVKKLLMPVINYRNGHSSAKKELYTVLRKFYPSLINNFDTLSRNYDRARDEFTAYKLRLKEQFVLPGKGDIAVAILGRPYTLLAKQMNKGIPDIFASLSVRSYFQDMLPDEYEGDIEPLLDAFHWSYAADILKAASYCAKTEGIYPVLVTSFKCSPDSFVQEYFARILDAGNKPYLILQIDEHDSNVGYETRIEAAIRSFRNHLHKSANRVMRNTLAPNPVLEKNLKGKTVLLPNWDPITIPLIAAVLKKEKLDVRVLEETPEKISEAMKTNTGQCIPLNAIVREFIDYIKKHGLAPENSTLWLPSSNWACNIGMYPHYAKSLLESEGNGMEKAGVYVGNITQIEFGPQVSIQTYLAYLFSGILHKFGCRFRPYEKITGSTDAAIAKGLDIFVSAFTGETNLKKAIDEVLHLFQKIEVNPGNKPKVAIFGDIYVRDNPVMNQDLVRFIERSGGEVVVTPYNEYAKIVSSSYFKIWMKKLQIADVILFKALLAAMEFIEGNYYPIFEPFIGKPASSDSGDIEKKLAQFYLRYEQVGETNDNILKINHIMEKYPDLAFFVHTSPAFCCPSLTTESFCRKIEETLGVPVVNIIYDGTRTFRNEVIMPYLKYPRKIETSRIKTDDSSILARGLDNIFQMIAHFMKRS